jgi:hypothetical protein
VSHDTYSRTNAYNDSLGECFSRHSLEHAQMTWALRPGTPRPLRLAIALIVGLMVFGVAYRTKAEESGHWTGPWDKDARSTPLYLAVRHPPCRDARSSSSWRSVKRKRFHLNREKRNARHHNALELE